MGSRVKGYHLSGMLLQILGACVANGSTLQPLVDARADQLVEDAEMAIRLGIGAAALGAVVAPLSLGAWGQLDGRELSVHPELEELLRLEVPGGVTSKWCTEKASVHQKVMHLNRTPVGTL